MSKHPLSATMVDALVMAQRNAGTLIRHPGGYWTYAGCQWTGSSFLWSVGTPTVNSLVSRRLMGWAEWKGRRGGNTLFPIKATLTDAARIVLEELCPEPALAPIPETAPAPA